MVFGVSGELYGDSMLLNCSMKCSALLGVLCAVSLVTIDLLVLIFFADAFGVLLVDSVQGKQTNKQINKLV